MDLFLALEKLELVLDKTPANPYAHLLEIERLNNARKLIGAPPIFIQMPRVEEAYAAGINRLRQILIEEIKIIKTLAREERAHNLKRNAADKDFSTRAISKPKGKESL